MKKVLITGMSGLIGGVLRKQLESVGGYELTAFNRSLVEGVRSIQGDITDFQALLDAFQGQEVVVHLAAYLGGQDWEGQLNGNVIATYNVFEAARQAGVKRVIFASSGNSVRGFERIPPYSHIAAGEYDKVSPDFPRLTPDIMRPAEIYGAAKVWGEALGRHFSDAFDMSILCVRIGSVTKGNRPRSSREFSIYLSQDDVAQVLHKCIEAPDDLKYDVFMATSNNKWSYRDISHTREVLGYEPKDSADDFR